MSMAKPKDAYEELEVEIEVRHKSYNRFGYTSRNGVVTTRKDRKIVLQLAGREAVLHIPTCADALWDFETCQINTERLDVPFPIIMPSSGRPQEAYLDLAETLDGLSCIRVLCT